MVVSAITKDVQCPCWIIFSIASVLLLFKIVQYLRTFITALVETDMQPLCLKNYRNDSFFGQVKDFSWAQQMKVLAAKANDESLIPRTNMVEGNRFPQTGF